MRDALSLRRALSLAALLCTLGVLLLHARWYAFLTDDAYISFRYARNLAEGHGLVFNPGMPPVEGYTNFLWVLILAGVERFLGVAPEVAANPLLLACTVGLWALVAREALRSSAPEEPFWPVLVPLALLALCRSVAVWSTSGLETRLFELLVVGGVFRLLSETRALASGDRVLPVSGAIFALATLVRPDGALIALSALFAAAVSARGAWRQAWRSWALQVALFALPVALHVGWRLSYYGEWVPNTWFAKVGGLTWWSMGGPYLASFALEYGVPLWLPLVAAALLRHRRRGSTHIPFVYAAVVIPHALYIARIGGDHFEYRPLDLYLPFLFLLLGDGVREVTRWIREVRSSPRRRGAAAAAAIAYGALLLLGLTWIPWQSHRQFPDRFVPGFPGLRSGDAQVAAFLDFERDPLMRLPVLKQWAAAHRRLLHHTTSRLVGIRAEEHRLFVEAAEPTGVQLRSLVEQGVLPPDTHIAVSAAGVVPYLSGLRTLDRLGLNDAVVARSPVVGPRMMGHDRLATLEYAALIGVDLWAEDPVHLVLDLEEDRLAVLLDEAGRTGQEVYVAQAGDAALVVRLPGGVEAARRRFPALTFHSVLRDSVAVTALAERMRSARLRRLMADPTSVEARIALAVERADAGHLEDALRTLEGLSEEGDPRVLTTLATLYGRAGRPEDEVAALRRAVRAAPDLRGLDYNLGVALGRLGRWGEAREAFTRAVSLEPGDPQVRHGLGAACFFTQDEGCFAEQLAVLERMGTAVARGYADNLRGLRSP